jgi:hypothetical protein
VGKFGTLCCIKDLKKGCPLEYASNQIPLFAVKISFERRMEYKDRNILFLLTQCEARNEENLQVKDI